MKIISGGQTGADRAALDAAISLDIPHGGWVPKGRKAEDGKVPYQYNLQEMMSPKYRDRTQKNILESQGTLIFSFGPLTGGSALTEALAIRYNRPCLHVNLEHTAPDKAVAIIEDWLMKKTISTLNVAGPRASGEPGIYKAVKHILCKVKWHD